MIERKSLKELSTLNVSSETLLPITEFVIVPILPKLIDADPLIWLFELKLLSTNISPSLVITAAYPFNTGAGIVI